MEHPFLLPWVDDGPASFPSRGVIVFFGAPGRVNVNGGAVSVGHPTRASGARILTTLLYLMEGRGERYRVSSLCIGGGEAVAVLVERT